MHRFESEVDVASIAAARARIASTVGNVVVRRAASLSSAADVHLVLENEQPTGSFKIRGAANAVLSHIANGVGGLTTASTGNHACAVARIGRSHDLPVHAFVARDVSDERVRRLRAESAQVDATSATQSEAIDAAQSLATEPGYAFVPPFDDPLVICGQGTLGLEIVAALPDAEVVVVPVSGGGLAAGVAVAIKDRRPTTRIVGVCADHAPSMRESLDAGYPVSAHELPTVADSLLGDLGRDNRHTFRLVRDHVDEIVVTTEADIVDARRFLQQHEGLAVEGAAAAATAYVRTHTSELRGLVVASLVTGAADDVGG